ncbi:MAG: protein-glutamine glutaminase family protein [Nocardioidaceae bacterium]
MPNENAIVSTVLGVEPPLDRPPAEMLRAEPGLSVELEEGRRARLDPEDPRSAAFAQILDGLSKQRLPVYLEIDAETSTITRLLIPHVARVVAIRPFEGDALGVELEPSHAVHVLRADAPDRAELERRLLDAERSGTPVAVTETDAHEIIDVRDYTPGQEGPFFPPPRRPPPAPARRELPTRPSARLILDRLWHILWWLWWWLHCPSRRGAQEVFDAMNATSCPPLTVPAPCIPFLYPDDGCWARAHEMCRLMINMGLTPRKVWIQGSLHVATRNNPTCSVHWGWHVAPTLCVRVPWFFFLTQRMVIDPSLFTTPVPEATWKGVQSDPNAVLTHSDASDYLWGATDPYYVQTNYYLNFYRLQLQNRAIQQGPPPYAYCP